MLYSFQSWAPTRGELLYLHLFDIYYTKFRAGHRQWKNYFIYTYLTFTIQNSELVTFNGRTEQQPAQIINNQYPTTRNQQQPLTESTGNKNQ